ncbi:hypothetical protein CNMCM6106_003925 [Aspergillus hiratsukae]|uniref:C2H2-type domain-containing protein n=1 Tax=Aspergillus hiratsukae TaxID=1194566 RepID=A0A8H6PNG7_9EURO|nr:hypothetical protein CNMCM6106_003925 [Aspergillus hiratsukae]
MAKDRTKDAVEFSYVGDSPGAGVQSKQSHLWPFEDAGDIVPETIEPDPVPEESRQSPKLYVPSPNEMVRLRELEQKNAQIDSWISQQDQSGTEPSPDSGGGDAAPDILPDRHGHAGPPSSRAHDAAFQNTSELQLNDQVIGPGQPMTANEAARQFVRNAQECETASRAATGGAFSQIGLEDARSLNSGSDFLSDSNDPEVASFDVFREEIIRLDPRIQPFLADRLADAQVRRYRRLAEARVRHTHSASLGTCAYCAAQEGRPLGIEFATQSQPSLPVVNVIPENLPSWAPLPPVKQFPGQFECPICFDMRAFSELSAWINHIREDVAPYMCLFPECELSRSFKTRKDLTRHENQVHGRPVLWHCSLPACPYITSQENAMIGHLRWGHNISGGPSSNTFPGPSKRETAAYVGSHRAFESCQLECVGTALDEPCRFCGRIYSTRQALQVHLAEHMEQIAMPVLKLLNWCGYPVLDFHEQLTTTEVEILSTVAFTHDSNLIAVDSERNDSHHKDVSSLEPAALDRLHRFSDPSSPIKASDVSADLHKEVDVPPSFTAGTFTDSGYASTKHGMSSKARSGDVENVSQVAGEHLTRSNDPSDCITVAEPDPMEVAEDTEQAEVSSVYSDASSISDEKREMFISELAEEFANVVRPYQPDEQSWQRISELLPELLRGFAFRFGHNASSQMYRDVMVFIHKHRRNVAMAFRDRCSEPGSADADGRDEDGMKMSLSELMFLWNSKIDPVKEGTPGECETGLDTTMTIVEERHETPEDEAEDGVQEDDEDQENDDHIDGEHKTTESPDLTVYRNIILEAPAFKALVAALQRECLLVTPESDVMREIGQKLLKHLPLNPRISRKGSPQTFTMKCTVNWDPITFLITQEYTQRPADAFETATTLTGSNRTAQAAPCGRYLSQTWPSTGEHIMGLIKCLILRGFHSPQSGILPDGSEIVAELQGAPGDSSSMLYAEVTGTPYSIIEAVEQLAWLGAALRSSPIESGVAYCRPVVDCSREVQGEGEAGWRAEHHCKIDYIFRTEEDTEENSLMDFNGRCWYHLFRNPVVVEGYPIPRRPESTAAVGLEIPLNMMAGLAQAHRISTFNGWTVLKGWSTLLVPTEQKDGLVFWHLKHHPDGERTSFRQCETFSPIKASIPALEKARHVLGWCTEMQFFGGAADASYNVRPSRLPGTSEDCLLDKAYISSGPMISGGHPFSIGRKDIPLHISRHSYIRKLRWIAQKFVVLWDEGDKRGWLVNGTSALLHLVRAAMKQASVDHFKSYLLFDPGQLQESRRSHEPTAAVDVLMDPSNRALKVYQEKDDYIRFENQVEHFYDLLEKVIDHQYDAVQRRDLDYSNIPRAYLEGWDFHELAAEVDPVHPRVAILESMGKSWVDLARSIHAVTLFGRGFGEIIKPTVGTCWQWARLPKGRYYVSACMSDLKDIMNTRGDPDSIPMKLVDNILWHNSDSSFVPCRCKGEDGETHSDFAQVLLPSSMAREMLQNMSRTADLNNGGAVIFGQNRETKWFWGDTGEPSRECEEVLMSQAVPGSPFHDSGIGRSVASSTSKMSESMVGLCSGQGSVDQFSDEPQSGNAGSEDTGILSITSLHERSQDLVPEDYKVGIVCALYLELMAVRTLFDSEHEGLTITDNDPNYYALGRIGRHNVVAACLPDGEYGTNSATSVAWNMKRTFTGVKFCLLVGIGGGVPSSENDIRLGDVVVSRPTGTLGGVLNYELGKALGKGEFQPHGCLPPAPGHLMSAVSDLRSDPRISSTPLEPYLEQIASRNPEYRHPGAEKDRLFASDNIHLEECERRGTCDSCASRGELKRPARLSTHPKIHYGLIASGNKVVRDAEIRDQLGNEYNVLCFEMEAAGVMLALPCLVIRGICDYADSHKNKVWQEYATGAAAAYAKLLLSRVRPSLGPWEAQRADFESASRHQPPKRARTGSTAGIEPSSGPKRTRH